MVEQQSSSSKPFTWNLILRFFNFIQNGDIQSESMFNLIKHVHFFLYEQFAQFSCGNGNY